MIINHKVIRTMKEHKTQYLGSILLILLSCMLFTLFNIMGENIMEILKEFKQQNVQEDASFIVSNKLDNILTLESSFNIILEERGFSDYSFEDNSTLRLLSETTKIDKYALVEGYDLNQSGDILLDPGYAKAHNIGLDSSLQLYGKDFKVTGFVSTPDYIYPLKSESDVIKNPEGFGIAILSKVDYSLLNQGVTFYSVKFQENNKQDFMDYLNKSNIVIKWVSKEDNMRITFIEGDLKGIGPIGKVLPLAILIITCVLVSVVLWRLLKQEYPTVGALSALGYRKSELIKHYLLYGIYLSIPGSILGTILGVSLVKPLITFVANFYNLPVIQIYMDPSYIVLSLILPFLFVIPTTFLVAFKAFKLTPLDLLRGGNNQLKLKFLEKKVRIKKLKFNSMFKIREIIRNIPRSLLMILGVTFASILLLMGFSLKDSLDYLMSSNFNETYHYEYDYTFNTLQLTPPDEGEMVSFSPFTLENEKNEEKTLLVYGLQKDAKLITLLDSEGKNLSLNQVIISKSLAEKKGIKEGDILEIKNKITSKEISLTVDKIAEFYLGETIYMPLERFNEVCSYPKGSYIELYSTKELDISPNNLISTINKTEALEGYKTVMEPIQYMVGMIGFAAFVIGLIIIYVVTSLIIEENKHNISLMKILGYRKKELYKLLLNVNNWFVIVGYIISIPLVIYFVDVFFKMMTLDMSISIPVKLNNIYIFFGFVIVFMTYEIAKLLNRKKILNINMADSLKNRME